MLFMLFSATKENVEMLDNEMFLLTIVENFDGSLRDVGKGDDFRDGSFVCGDSAKSSLVQTRVYLLDQLQCEEGEDERLVLQDDH